MKTIRNILILALLTFAIVSPVNADGIQGKPKKEFKTTLNSMIRNHPELVFPMYKQIDRSFLEVVEEIYVVKFEYNGAIYQIMGSRQDWIMFFKSKIYIPPRLKIMKQIL